MDPTSLPLPGDKSPEPAGVLQALNLTKEVRT